MRLAAVGFLIETSCTYFEAIAFPDTVQVGVKVTKLGHSSVRYEVGIFKNNQTVASAQGYFVHVYVDKKSQRPTAIPEQARTALTTILAKD